MTTSEDLALVLGGTGKTGRRVAERLHAAGGPVRVGSRAGMPPFDWDDRARWAPALPGASAVYVSFFPGVAVSQAPEAIAAFAELAAANGSLRLVLISGRGEEEAQRAEEALQASGASWTVVRCSWFMQNFSEGYLRDAILAGHVALPVDDVPEPFVDAEDIADIAAGALTENGHAGRVYELTGPRMLTFAEAANEIADALGRPVIFERVPPAAYTQALRAEQLPEELVSLVTYLFGAVLDGRNAHLSDGVQAALGRPARDFTDFARKPAAAGVWRGD